MNPLTLRIARLCVLLSLAAVAAAAVATAFFLRFEFELPANQVQHLFVALAVAVPLSLVVSFAMRVHKGWRRPASTSDLLHLMLAASIAWLVWAAVVAASTQGFPRSIYAMNFVLTLVLTAALRVACSIARDVAVAASRPAGKNQNILVYGTGPSAAGVVDEIRATPRMGLTVVGLVDTDSSMQGQRVRGIPIFGTGRDLVKITYQLERRGKKVDSVLIALTMASGKQMREAISNCRAAGLTCKTLPGIGDLLKDRGLTSQIREISVNDLLAREPVELDEAGIHGALQGRTVLITGAGGSIGSELCRQVCAHEPAALLALDQAESDLYRIEVELHRLFPHSRIHAEIGDVRNIARVDELMRAYRIDTVFHAAAYKHVPLMESNCLDACDTNVIGTWNLIQTAMRHGVSSFILVSSDKAVNPTNVMGATKRAAELVVSSACDANSGGTNFVSVRFGNVLGSNGSVVPLFRDQIAGGGPVTVTHPDVKRYFMTVREAVQLVLQASIMGGRGEVFILDMGEPIKIVDLARNMIQLTGLVPSRDIEIRFTGLRPGEKLYEELVLNDENVLTTQHERIKIVAGNLIDYHRMQAWIRDLHAAIRTRDRAATITLLKELIPEYSVSPDCLRPRGVNGYHVATASAAGRQ